MRARVTVIRELGRGDALGELALIERLAALGFGASGARERAPRRRSARTSKCGCTTRHALSLALNRILAEQLRSSRSTVSLARPRPTTVALLGFGDGAPLAHIAHGLTLALEQHLSTVLLDGSETDAPSIEEMAGRYGPLLDRAEAGHDLVVLMGGSVLSGAPWTEFCLQQADRILAVTAGGPVPAALLSRPELQGCDLVAYGIEPGAGELQGWAAALEPIESHAVRDSAFDADLARAARRLSGRSIGVVLSGGGARAFAHIGVLEELTAAGVTVDRVAGVSMGAFVGALFAMGIDADEMDARCFEEWVQRSPLRDYTLPRHALIRGQRAEAMLRRTFGEVAIEELERSFMCGCAELRSGRLVVLRSGPLWEAVGFSICIPVLAPPQVRGREMFIDGSLVDNLPVATMADLGEGPIIAVDVKATFESGSGTAGARGEAIEEERIPSLGETLTRVLLLGSANTSEAAREHAAVIIKPRAEGVGLLEFHQLDAAREAGRAAARDALETGLPALFG